MKTSIRYAREKYRVLRERETPSETHRDDGNTKGWITELSRPGYSKTLVLV